MSLRLGALILSIFAPVQHSEAALSASTGPSQNDGAFFSSGGNTNVAAVGGNALVCNSRGYCFVATGSAFGKLSQPIDLDQYTKSIVGLSDTQALLCYEGCVPQAGTTACGIDSKNSCVVLTVLGTTVAIGLPYQFTQAAPTGMWSAVGVGALSTTVGMVCARFGGSFDVHCTTLAVAGSSVSGSTLVKVGRTGTTSDLSVTGLSASLAVLCYPEANTRHLVCHELAVAGGAVTGGAQVRPRADQGQVTVRSIATAKMSTSSFLLCYDFAKMNDKVTLCNYMSTSPLQSSSAYTVANKHSMSVSVAALSASTAVVCYKEEVTTNNYDDACRDIDLTNAACHIGADWKPARSHDIRSTFGVVKRSSSGALVCSGKWPDSGCDIVSVDNARSDCTAHSPGTHCDPEGGNCGASATSGASGTSASGTSGTSGTGGASSATSGAGATGGTDPGQSGVSSGSVAGGSDALFLATVLAAGVITVQI